MKHKTHYSAENSNTRTACGMRLYEKYGGYLVTRTKSQVNCRRCKHTKTFQEKNDEQH